MKHPSIEDLELASVILDGESWRHPNANLRSVVDFLNSNAIKLRARKIRRDRNRAGIIADIGART